jgi:site-specific recombinase XerD
MTIECRGAVAPLTPRDCVGPIASYVDRFAKFLAEEGYTRITIERKRWLAADLSGWLKRRGLPLARLNEGKLERFCAEHRHSIRRGDVSTGHQLLMWLRGLGLVAALPQKIDRTVLGQLTRDYEIFLRSQRGLALLTLKGYMRIVRIFLSDRFKQDEVRIADLRPHDLHRFLLRQVPRGSRSYAKFVVTALRSFLGFLFQRGAIKTDLLAGVPGVANWRLSHLPKALPPDQVEQLLQCCDRSTPSGQRDYAVLLLLARLGLRGGEVLAMTLDDPDWERGEIVVRGKGQRLERLPLPKDVGAALVHYLRHVRPTCSTRKLFIRLKAPRHGLRVSAICCIVRRALQRAGLNPDLKGAHLLRHSLATNMLRRGASLGEIGQLLRHAHPTTTQIYAKVDIGALRRIALPWMGGAS